MLNVIFLIIQILDITDEILMKIICFINRGIKIVTDVDSMC